MRLPLAIILVTLASTAHAQSREQKPVDWRTFEVPDFGTRIQYPAGIFSPAGKPEKGVGQRFERADGRAVLSIYSRSNEAGDNPALFLLRIFKMKAMNGTTRAAGEVTATLKDHAVALG